MGDHPVKVPAELIEKVSMAAITAIPDDESGAVEIDEARDEYIAQFFAQWGADQELEACVEWIAKQDMTWTSAQLRAARRPKPPTLAEQGLKALGSPVGPNHVQFLTAANQDAIRAALNRLAELEAQQ